MQLLVLKNQTSTAENFKALMILSIQEVFSLLKFMALDISDLKSENHRITGQFRLRALLSFKDHQEWRCTNLSGPVPGFYCPHTEIFFHITNWNSPCSDLCLLPFVLSLRISTVCFHLLFTLYSLFRFLILKKEELTTYFYCYIH